MADSRVPGMSDLWVSVMPATLEIPVFPTGVLGTGQGLILPFSALYQLKNLTGLNQRR